MAKRDAYFDNVKFILIVLVVFGHLLTPFINDKQWLRTLYIFIYTFHMPAFILISGYFAKGYRKKGYMWKAAKKVLLPYIIFQLIYAVYDYKLYDESTFEVSVFQPAWSLWFLLSLFCWNAMLFIFTKIKYPLAVAAVLGIMIGLCEPLETTLSLSRTFVFFPFFLAGFYMKKEHFKKLTSVSCKKVAGGTLLIIALWIQYIAPDFEKEWLFGSKSYASLGVNQLEGMTLRMLFYSISLAMTISFLALIPTQTMSFTSRGAQTFYVYLLHGFLIKYIRLSSFGDWIESVQGYSILLIGACGVAWLLSSKYVSTIARPLIELKPLPRRKSLSLGK
ncbi:acyltransferase family protein [Priestia megaterium]|uniref:Acyltransferase family protein n=1 Tax=Priestia megaterium TaxID=1404 RepID=A0A6M6DTC0_PRIMG|nr:acyltransferase family protein [Priestia megaterium]KLV29724.1 acyltransferase [Priestia megaterium]MCE4090555.1 acyltransferase family protein [Priestia megaterium]QJX77842.1 acyltransferase family protein [Priestia megaterium]